LYLPVKNRANGKVERGSLHNIAVSAILCNQVAKTRASTAGGKSSFSSNALDEIDISHPSEKKFTEL